MRKINTFYGARSAILCLLVLVCSCQSFRMSRSGVPKDAFLVMPSMALGKIVSVQRAEKFVVIHFLTSKLPPLGTRLIVFRGEKQVGLVQITEPSNPPLATANILEGVLDVNDTVR